MTAGRNTYQITVSSADATDVAFDFSNVMNYYYLPWFNSPVQGDTTLTVSVTAQAAAPTLVTLNTDPPGLDVILENQSFRSPVTRAFPAGTSAGQRGGAASRLGFLRWSDGGDQVHDIAVGSSATALVAQFAKRDYTVPLIVLTNIPGIAPVAATKTMPRSILRTRVTDYPAWILECSPAMDIWHLGRGRRRTPRRESDEKFHAAPRNRNLA